MTELLKYYQTDDESIACPCCGGFYLHQEQVLVVEGSEGSPQTLAIIDQQHKKPRVSVQSDIDYKDHPLPTIRNGLSVKFWCEDCGHTVVLNLVQQKGHTRVYWCPAVAAGNGETSV